MQNKSASKFKINIGRITHITYLGMGVFWQKFLISAGGVIAAMLW
jgi:hypothetical protein